MFACLMILFEDRSNKYAEAFSMQCQIIILVIFDKVLHGFILTYPRVLVEFCVIEVFKFWVRYRYEENKEWQEPKVGDAQGTPR